VHTASVWWGANEKSAAYIIIGNVATNFYLRSALNLGKRRLPTSPQLIGGGFQQVEGGEEKTVGC